MRKGNKWERKRYYQLRRNAYCQRGPSYKQIRHENEGAIRALERANLNLLKGNSELDLEWEIRGPRFYPKDKRFVLYGYDFSELWHNSDRILNLKPKNKEEKQHLPMWMQHQIKKNKAICSSCFNHV